MAPVVVYDVYRFAFQDRGLSNPDPRKCESHGIGLDPMGEGYAVVQTDTVGFV